MKEILRDIEGGTVSSYSLGEIGFENILKSIAITKNSCTYELRLSDFFDKEVYLYYDRTAKLLPRIVGGQVEEIFLRDDNTLGYVAVKQGDDLYILVFDEISDQPMWAPEDYDRTIYKFEIAVEKWEEQEGPSVSG